jgi:hypothetical protein
MAGRSTNFESGSGSAALTSRFAVAQHRRVVVMARELERADNGAGGVDLGQPATVDDVRQRVQVRPVGSLP